MDGSMLEYAHVYTIRMYISTLTHTGLSLGILFSYIQPFAIIRSISFYNISIHIFRKWFTNETEERRAIIIFCKRVPASHVTSSCLSPLWKYAWWKSSSAQHPLSLLLLVQTTLIDPVFAIASKCTKHIYLHSRVLFHSHFMLHRVVYLCIFVCMFCELIT